MAGIAAIARQAGHEVTGMRCKCLSTHEHSVDSQGIDLIEGYSPDQIKVTRTSMS